MLEQYEALRKAATGTGPFSHNGYGLALFLSRGMTGWLLAVRELVPLPLPVSTGDSPCLPDLPAAAQTDLTLLLADMVLRCQTEIRP